jgi:hypothetical protein
MEVVMREIFICVALAAVAALVVPAFAQTDDQTKTNGPTEQNQPGTGGQSKPGVPGLPGNKSGSSQDKSGAPQDDSSAGAAAGEEGAGSAAGSDESKVPGLPDNKSGSTDKAPSDDSMSK